MAVPPSLRAVVLKAPGVEPRTFPVNLARAIAYRPAFLYSAHMDVQGLGWCTVRIETQKAVLLKLFTPLSTLTELWVPKSCLAEGNQCRALGNAGQAFVTASWYDEAVQKRTPIFVGKSIRPKKRSNWGRQGAKWGQSAPR